MTDETKKLTAEEERLEEDHERKKHWKRWGPYLSERQWGTVREDYSPGGTAWEYFSHDQSRSRAYRWGEDGIGGICDRHGLICFALALWNGRDPILKERLFGLTGNEGNHGEDSKEYYFYLDSTPTHSYMRMLYKYPQQEFPYGRLVEENRRRSRADGEFELVHTGVFDDDRYFDVIVEYAKAGPDDILIRIMVENRAPEPAGLHLIPTLWMRNSWAWNALPPPCSIKLVEEREGAQVLELHHDYYGNRWLYCEEPGEEEERTRPELLFTENETNAQKLWGLKNRSLYVKDAFHDYLIHGKKDAVNPALSGTKAGVCYRLTIPPGGFEIIRMRLTDQRDASPVFGPWFEETFVRRIDEADDFYAKRTGKSQMDDTCEVQRQAFAGMLWSKQYYGYDVRTWLEGDSAMPPPPRERKRGRNRTWEHLYNSDVISMPDKWEYPWYAAWDLAFHCIPLAQIDPDFAKEQLLLLLREWYMHPNGQLPAYEWAFSDVNPPVHAWAALRVYKIERRFRGEADFEFLEKVFHKLLLNFTWWVNRKDPEGMNVFEGGFLGLDNIGVFDRSAPLPTGGHIEQSDGTSWMGMYCLNMLAIAMELASRDPAYEDVASKFFEHFVHIAHAMHDLGSEGLALWDDEDGFYYDVLHLPDGRRHPMKVRSMVGLTPLFAVQALEPYLMAKLPGFARRMQWFLENHPDVPDHIEATRSGKQGVRRLLSLVNRGRLERMARYLLDENEFLSPYGIRALSRFHREHPYELVVNSAVHRVNYEPAESSSGLFGGNSNWRGPIWFPVNYLLIEALQKFHHYFGDDLKVECPVGSGHMMNLWEVATEISRRLIRIFLRDANGRRAVFGGTEKFQRDPYWRDLIPFYEYFHGDIGAGIGANHQTGWTGLVAKLIEQSGV